MTKSPIELDAARRLVAEGVGVLSAEEVSLTEALGRTLAEEVIAERPVQGFDNSAMDGFAVRAADTAGASRSPVSLRVSGESRAGLPASTRLEPGEAIAISTGAAMPAGADAVVRVEETSLSDGRVLVRADAAPGRDVRRAGEDIAEGETVLVPGDLLGPAELGVLASLGRDSVRCHRRPRLALMTSGDELLDPGDPPRPGAVRDSNSVAIAALARSVGSEVSMTARLLDDLGATREGIAAGLEADVTVVCGGVSVGAHDHVKQAFAELGVEERFWGLNLKPGRPAWFGVQGRSPVFGLPGNPVSALVVFHLLVRAAIDRMAGRDPRRSRTAATLAAAVEKRPGRLHAVPCRLELREEGWTAHPAPRQGSHLLTSMLRADCLALLPAESGPLSEGDRVEIELLEKP
jgi:molybdopterin molybdotransferase